MLHGAEETDGYRSDAEVLSVFAGDFWAPGQALHHPQLLAIGDSIELDDPVAAHREVVAEAHERGIELIPVGTDLYGIEPVDDPVAAIGVVGDGDVVLVKASRVGGLERVVGSLLDT